MDTDIDYNIYLPSIIAKSRSINLSRQTFYIYIYVRIAIYTFENLLLAIDGVLDCLEKLDHSIDSVDSLSIWQKISWVSF